MPNQIDENGLQTATYQELLDQFTADLQAIYGPDINLSSDTPDGQLVNIFIQAVLDLEDLILQTYNSFDPDNAIGRVLDQRVAFNGIQRQAGTFTITPIEIVLTQSVNLFGLDQDEQEVYTVSDGAGNQWQLQETQLGVGPGTVTYSFQAATPGANLTIPNTITIPVTIVLGVQSVNNPSAATTLGVNEESDAQLRVRRQQSVSLASQGYLAGLLAALENITGVTSAFVYENVTGSTDGDGIPGHSIWVIVAGTGAAEDIAQAIYSKRNAGCGMKGDVEYTITQVNGQPFIVKWDTVDSENLFIQFSATSLDGINLPNIDLIKSQLVEQFVPGVYEELNINALATLVQSIDPNTLVTDAGFSTGKLQTLSLSAIPASGDFKVEYNGNQSAAINWNDSIGTIQSKVQAVTGLSAALVTGSLASQELVFDLSAISSVLSLITVADNTLQDGGAADIDFEFDNNYTPTLTPSSKQNQFILEGDNIVIIPMQLLPATYTAMTLGDKTFTAYGGYGENVFSFVTNNSGGSIDPSSGEYTAGATPGTDTIKVTDDLGNTATAVITVS